MLLFFKVYDDNSYHINTAAIANQAAHQDLIKPDTCLVSCNHFGTDVGMDVCVCVFVCPPPSY